MVLTSQTCNIRPEVLNQPFNRHKGIPGFLVPFMFVYGSPLLLIGEPLEILLVTGTAVAGVTALAGATMGYLRSPLTAWERAVLGGGAIALIFPGLASDGCGLLALLFIFLRNSGKDG